MEKPTWYSTFCVSLFIQLNLSIYLSFNVKLYSLQLLILKYFADKLNGVESSKHIPSQMASTVLLGIFTRNKLLLMELQIRRSLKIRWSSTIWPLDNRWMCESISRPIHDPYAFTGNWKMELKWTWNLSLSILNVVPLLANDLKCSS